METNLIIFIIFAIIIIFTFSEAISIFIIREKGRKLWEGIILGLFPIFGHIWGSFLKPTDTFLVNEMYQRDLITKEEYDKTIEIKLNKKP